MSLANKISFFRIVCVPVLLIGLLNKADVWPLLVFSILALSDVMDGWAARRRKERTLLGNFLDPVADKLLLDSCYLVFVYLDYLPMWVFVVVFSRDVLIFWGWNIIYRLTKKLTAEPRWLGKITTFLQMTGVVVVMGRPYLTPVQQICIWIMVCATALSAIDYVCVGAGKLNQLG